MLRKSSVFIITLLFLFGCKRLYNAKPPDNIVYQRPTSDVPYEIQRLLGKWEGNWDGDKMNSLYIFEKVTPSKAYIVNANGIYFPFGSRIKNNRRIMVDLSIKGRKVYLKSSYKPEIFSLTGTLSEDGESLELKSSIYTNLLKKIGEPKFPDQIKIYPAIKRYSLPTVKGPIPATEESYPFNATNKSIRDQHIEKFGYVEEEFFISSQANIYDLDFNDNAVVIKTDAFYTNRILVRRPESEKKFSGTVVVELLNPQGRLDFDVQWLLSREYFMRSGDVWIGITSKPVAVKALQKFDPERYKSLSWKNPFPPEERCSDLYSLGNLNDTTPENENGLIWDIINQVGTLLKSDKRENLLIGFSVKNVLLTGYAETNAFMVTYINYIRPLASARLANGKPVYDGYLIGDGDSFAYNLSQCGFNFYIMDPRIVLRPCPEPVISVVTQTM